MRTGMNYSYQRNCSENKVHLIYLNMWILNIKCSAKVKKVRKYTSTNTLAACICISSIQRAVIASTYPFLPTFFLKLICIKRGKVQEEHDVSNGAICCSLAHTAPNYSSALGSVNVWERKRKQKRSWQKCIYIFCFNITSIVIKRFSSRVSDLQWCSDVTLILTANAWIHTLVRNSCRAPTATTAVLFACFLTNCS